MPARGDRWSVALVILSTLALSGCAGASSPSGSAAASAAPGSSSPTASTAASQPPSSAPSAFPATVPSGATGRTWSDPTALTSASRYGSVQAVAASPDRWVAVGGAEDWTEDASGRKDFLWDRARVWTSIDGTGWTLLPHEPVFDGGSMFGVAWTPRGFIAVGTWKDRRPDPDGAHIIGWGPAAWLSTDGLTWVALDVEQDRGTREDQGRINAVVEFDGRIVAIGCLDESCLYGQAAWILEGDRFWRATGVPPGVPAGAYDVVRSPAGLVAVGTLRASEGPTPRSAAWASAWISADGEVWSRIDAIDDRDWGFMVSVARAADSLVAVGYVADPQGARPAAWTSHDSGVSWQEGGRDDFGGVTGMSLHDVVFSGEVFVAVAWIEEEPFRGAVWVSADGSRWERIDLPGSGAPAVSIADGPGGLVVVGGYVNRTMSAWWSPAGATAP